MKTYLSPMGTLIDGRGQSHKGTAGLERRPFIANMSFFLTFGLHSLQGAHRNHADAFIHVCGVCCCRGRQLP